MAKRKAATKAWVMSFDPGDDTVEPFDIGNTLVVQFGPKEKLHITINPLPGFREITIRSPYERLIVEPQAQNTITVRQKEF